MCRGQVASASAFLAALLACGLAAACLGIKCVHQALLRGFAEHARAEDAPPTAAHARCATRAPRPPRPRSVWAKTKGIDAAANGSVVFGIVNQCTANSAGNFDCSLRASRGRAAGAGAGAPARS
jgi:hypothetical protein